MKRFAALVMALMLFVLTGAFADTTSLPMVMTSVEANGYKLGQCLAPEGYTVTGVLNRGETDPRSLQNPMGLGIMATAKDQGVMMAYETSVTYLDLVQSSLGGESFRNYPDGTYEQGSNCVIRQYQGARAYGEAYIRDIFPGVEMVYLGSRMDEKFQSLQPVLDEIAQKDLDELKADNPALYGMELNGNEVQLDYSIYGCTMGGREYAVVIYTLVSAAQITRSVYMPAGGMLTEGNIFWIPNFHYMLAAPADALESVFPAFELFVENTVASDQFLKANEKLGVELANIVSRSRMQYIDDLLAQETTGNDSYNEDRFSDYLFDQNDYTLSDGSHVKIPTEYDHVYEGDNNTIYFSSSAFGGTGTELTPNR